MDVGGPPMVVYQGDPGAYGDEAAARLAPGLDARGLPTFEAVFRAVRDGEARVGVVPVENVYGGPVDDSAEHWAAYAVSITGDLWLPLSHVLAGVPGARLDALTTVRSHPQALRQCAPYLCRHRLRAEASHNTATAAREVAEAHDPAVAALASRRAAALYGLQVLDERVSAVAGNETRFWRLERAPVPHLNGTGRFSALVSLGHPGAAAARLAAFGSGGVHLDRLVPVTAEGHRLVLMEGAFRGPQPGCLDPAALCRLSVYPRLDGASG